MKFLLVPLFIIGMFVSFIAALIAMLFFTRVVQTPQELRDLFIEKPDSMQVFEEFRFPEKRLEELFNLAQEYKNHYQEQTQLAEAVQESLANERLGLQVMQDSLDRLAVELGQMAESTYRTRQQESLDELAKFYGNIKPQLAAEILQQESELSDTTAALLMKKLPPRQMARIMGSMNPDFAARITMIMKALP